MKKVGFRKLTVLTLCSCLINYVTVDAMPIGNNNKTIENLEIENNEWSTLSSQNLVDINIIKSINASKSEVNIGESIEFKVEVDEKYVDIYDISLGIVKNNKNGVGKTIKLNYNKENKIYAGSVEFDNTSPSGEWSVDRIIINGVSFDNRTQSPVMNFFYFDNPYRIPFNLPKFNVKGSESLFDTICPKLQGIYFDKKEAQIGDIVKVSVKAVDENEIDANSIILSLGIDGIKMPGIMVDKFIYNEKTGMFEDNFTVDKYVPTGKFIAQKMIIRDVNSNFIYLNSDELKSTSKINIKGKDNIDIVAPVFNRVSVNKQKASVNEKVIITVDAYDNESKINWIRASYKINGKYSKELFLQYNPKTSKYEYEININDYTPNGKWELTGLEIMNSAESRYTNRYLGVKNLKNLVGGSFYIDSKGLVDSTHPVVKSFNIDKTTCVISDTIKISQDVEDSESGVESVYLSYNKLENGDDSNFIYYPREYLPLKYNEVSKKYEAELKVTQEVYESQLFKGPIIDDSLEDGEMVNKKIGWFLPYKSTKDISGNSSNTPRIIINIFNTDINLDNKVDKLDLDELGKSYNQKDSDINWDAKKDFNKDNKIDIFDIVIVAKTIKNL